MKNIIVKLVIDNDNAIIASSRVLSLYAVLFIW